MRVRSHPEADQELAAVVEYYERCNPGLGGDFLDEFERGIRLIRENPDAWPVKRKDARCCLIHRFPYGLIYKVGAEEIVLVAVMHLKRRPFYWKDRI